MRTAMKPGVGGGRVPALVLVLALALALGCSARPPPTGWDVAAYWQQADAAARAWHGDAELVLVTADATDAKGNAHLETPKARLRFEYRSQVDLAQTAREHVGVSAGRPANCLFSLYIHDQRAHLSTGMRTGDCAGPRLGPVRCTVARIWERAIAKGAPASALANLELHLSGELRRWRFVILDRASNQPVVDETFADDC
jgi:hypothetical protein